MRYPSPEGSFAEAHRRHRFALGIDQPGRSPDERLRLGDAVDLSDSRQQLVVDGCPIGRPVRMSVDIHDRVGATVRVCIDAARDAAERVVTIP